jgi:DNA mismatch endonuclease, patch repair protein
MRAIKGKANATTELALATLFRRDGISGWRRHLPLPGRPDFAFPKLKVAVFVDGCFWHACPRCYLQPSRNTEFWKEKAASNQRRDRRVAMRLRRLGWAVARIWEHELARAATTPKRLKGMLKRGASKPREAPVNT